MTNNSTPFLVGKSIILRVLSENDIKGNYQKWLNDCDVNKYNSHHRFPMSLDKMLEYVRSISFDTSKIVLAVQYIQSGEHIGNISIQNINWIDRSGEIAFLLGESQYFGKGIMYEAGQLLIKHGFDSLNLNRIYCGTSSENLAMQKLAIKLGMKQEGIRRKAFFKSGEYYDVFEYGILRTEIV